MVLIGSLQMTADSDPDVRNAANLAIAASLRCVGIVQGEKSLFVEAMSDAARKTKVCYLMLVVSLAAHMSSTFIDR